MLSLLARGVAVLGFASLPTVRWAFGKGGTQDEEATMILPSPNTDGSVSVEQALRQRRTIRSYRRQSLQLRQLSQLLWAAQGITESRGSKRAAPSAGALYPMDIYAVLGVGSVADLEAGVYRYESEGHKLLRTTKGDLRDGVAKAALSQMWMAAAPVEFVITAEYRRINVKYGQRGVQYAMIEAGHIGQNLFLQAEALGLRAGIVGALNERALIETLKLPRAHEPLLIMPVGYEG